MPRLTLPRSALPFCAGLLAGAVGGAIAASWCRGLRWRRRWLRRRTRPSVAAPPPRTVLERDALEWLKEQTAFPSHACVVTGLPDVVEAAPGARQMSIEQYRVWFEDVAILILSRLAEGSRAIFVQTDVKAEDSRGSFGEWVDKSFLLQRAAQRVEGIVLLWHKIACFDAVGGNSSRCGGLTKTRYSHMLCFGRMPCSERHLGPVASVPDVLRRGHVTWARGTGVRCCLALCRYAKKAGFSMVIDPFCGEGIVLAVAGHCGLESLGVEVSRKRAEVARKLDAEWLIAKDAMDELS